MKLRKRGKFLCGHKMTPPRKHENNTTWQNYFPSFFLQGCEKSIVNTKGKSMVLNDVIDVVCTKEFVMLKENIENEGRK